MNDEKEKQALKVVLLGNSGVGKTALVTRWTTGSYQKSIKPTIGANHQRKTVVIGKEGETELYLWDTAGQEQFQALTPLYARSAAAAVVTASVNDIESFNSLQTWIDLLHSSCEKVPPMILAVNKIDIVEEAIFSNEEIETRFGPQFSAIFFVSAVTGEGVDTCFMQAAQAGFDFVKNGCISEKTLKEASQNEKKEKCC